MFGPISVFWSLFPLYILVFSSRINLSFRFLLHPHYNIQFAVRFLSRQFFSLHPYLDTFFIFSILILVPISVFVIVLFGYYVYFSICLHFRSPTLFWSLFSISIHMLVPDPIFACHPSHYVGAHFSSSFPFSVPIFSPGNALNTQSIHSLIYNIIDEV